MTPFIIKQDYYLIMVKTINRIPVFALFFVFLFARGSGHTQVGPQKDKSAMPRHFRFIYNSDADNMFIGASPTTPEMLDSYVDEVAKTGATSFFISPNWGMPMNYPTKVGDMVGEHLDQELEARALQDETTSNFRNLLKNVHDPLAFILERAKAHQMEAFVSFRLNEVHDVENQESLLFDRFWRAHPEWHIGKPGDSIAQVYTDIMGPRTHPVVNSWLPAGLNFAIPEVRKFRLAQLREICEGYDIDGLELDFQRFPMYFKPGEEQRGIKIMSAWMREVRAMVEEAGKKRGRPILLTARVLALPEQNKAIGLDPLSWARDGILDFAVVSHYLHNNFPLPIEEYRALFPRDYPIYASVEVEPGMERFFNIAYPLWRKKIDGIYLFNFFFAANKGKTPATPYDSIRKFGYPLVARDSILLVANKHANTLSYVNPKTFEIIKTVPTGPNPTSMVITPDHRTAYLSNFEPNQGASNKISLIDLGEDKPFSNVSTSYYGRLNGAAISPDGRYVYLTSEYLNYVVEIETATKKFVRSIPAQGRAPHMVYVSPDGKYLLTANRSSGHISVINRSSGCLYKKILLGTGIEAMAFAPDRKWLWALNKSRETVTIIDMQTLQPVEHFICRGMPGGIRFTSDGKRALITGGTKQGTLTVIDVATRKEIKRIKVGDYATGIELSPGEKYAFIGCEDSLQAGNAPHNAVRATEQKKESDGVHVVDMEKLEVVSTIKTGLGPDAMLMWYPPDF